MITAYAILATFFLGVSVRHNFAEMRAYYLMARATRKHDRMLAREEKKRKEVAAKVGPNPFTA